MFLSFFFFKILCFLKENSDLVRLLPQPPNFLHQLISFGEWLGFLMYVFGLTGVGFVSGTELQKIWLAIWQPA